MEIIIGKMFNDLIFFFFQFTNFHPRISALPTYMHEAVDIMQPPIQSIIFVFTKSLKHTYICRVCGSLYDITKSCSSSTRCMCVYRRKTSIVYLLDQN